MKLEKILKVLDEDMLSELNNMNEAALKEQITKSEQSIKVTRDELEANPKFQELKENLKALRHGYSEVKTFQTAKIQYALIRLEEMGKE